MYLKTSAKAINDLASLPFNGEYKLIVVSIGKCLDTLMKTSIEA